MAPLEDVVPTRAASPVSPDVAAGPWTRVCGRLAVPVALGGVALLAVRLLRGLDGPATVPLAALGFVAGWVAADLASGLVHWWADRVAREDLPWIGPGFVQAFRDHHAVPTSICGHGFLDTNGNNCIVVLPVLAAGLLFVPAVPVGPGAVLGTAFLVSLCAWACLTNQIHKWAHQPRVSPALRWLQRRGVLLSREHHAGHHAPPFATRYCITAGRLDFLLEASGLLRALERRFSRGPEPPHRRSDASSLRPGASSPCSPASSSRSCGLGAG